MCGQKCLERLGKAVHISANRITIHQPQRYPLSDEHCQLKKSVEPHRSRFENRTCHKFIPCPNKFVIKETHGDKRDSNYIYRITFHNETTTSIEDKRFLEIMEKGIHKNELGNWELPQSSSKTTTLR